MANKRLGLGILAFVLVFGMTAVGVEAQNNSGIEGIWNFPDEGIQFRFENGKCQVFDDGMLNEEGTYIIRGNTIIVEGDEFAKFSVKGNTLTLNHDGEIITGTKINQSSSSPLGRWVHEDGVKRNKPENIELFKDGTGICDGLSIKWKTDGDRLIIQSPLISLACNYVIIGSRLNLSYDDGGIATFAKK